MLLLSWDAKENLQQDGFSNRVLEDGRACLLWARGYFFDSYGHMRLDDEIVDWLAAQLVANLLPDLVPGMNGCFSVIVVWPEARIAEVGTDRFGTIPVYYHIGNRDLVISDSFWKVASQLSSVEYDPDAVLSMVLLGYVAGYGTLPKGITELPQAATHHFSFVDGVPELASQRYWMLSYRIGPQRKREVWRDALAQTLDSILKRHAQAILARGWDVHVPLSGGKDSRLLVGMFSRNGVPVQAFSYGSSSNAESQCASQVADALGVPFHFVPVDDPSCLEPSLIQTMTRRVGMLARFTAGLGGQLSLVAFSAQDVYVQGHTGDLVTGGQLRRGGLLVRSEAQAVRHLIDIHSLPVFDHMAAALCPGTWEAGSRVKVISSDWHFDADDPTGSIDRWDCENRQRRLVLSELRTYEQFARWMLPFYDYDLFDFFAAVPLRLRYQQRLYIDTLVHNMFVDDLAALAQISIAYKGSLQLPILSWRDWVLMRIPPGIVDEWILRRATDSKRREHLNSIGARSSEPSGPDPLDHWWYEHPSFRRFVIEKLSDWDGMHGIIDVRALADVLQRPLPRLFIQFTVPALLTLCAFQQIVEQEINSFTS